MEDRQQLEVVVMMIVAMVTMPRRGYHANTLSVPEVGLQSRALLDIKG